MRSCEELRKGVITCNVLTEQRVAIDLSTGVNHTDFHAFRISDY